MGVLAARSAGESGGRLGRTGRCADAYWTRLAPDYGPVWPARVADDLTLSQCSASLQITCRMVCSCGPAQAPALNGGYAQQRPQIIQQLSGARVDAPEQVETLRLRCRMFCSCGPAQAPAMKARSRPEELSE